MWGRGGPIKLQHFLCHPKTHEFPTTIRDTYSWPFYYPKLSWKVTFFLNFFSKNHLPLLPLKGHKNADFLPRYSVADGQRILDPSVLTHTIHGTRKYIYRHIDLTKIKHSCIGKYTIFPWIVWVMSLGFKWSCWIIDVSIVPFGSGKTLGFFKGRFTRFWCCLLIYIYIYDIHIFWCEKSTWLPISFFPVPWRVLLLLYLKRFEHSLPLGYFNHLWIGVFPRVTDNKS